MTRPYSRNHLLTAWGERRSVAEWAKDAHCAVDCVTILQRIERGWSPEDAIAMPSLRRYELTIWGETKRLFEWGADTRSQANAYTIAQRIARGWTPEEALTIEPTVQIPRQLTLDGETKTIAAWSRDSRCVPNENTLRRRLWLNWSLHDALTIPVKKKEQIPSNLVVAAQAHTDSPPR